MENPHLQFHHLGLAVRRPEEALKFLGLLGYKLGAPVLDPAQNVHLQMCTHPTQPAVEIIWPGLGPGPVDKLTSRHSAGIVYHVCYQTDDLAAVLQQWERAGVLVFCVSKPVPAPLFAGRKVSFYNVVGLGLVEMLEGIP
jgi:hypothetical protein